MFLIESITRQNTDLASIYFLFFFYILSGKFLTILIEAPITDEKQLSQSMGNKNRSYVAIVPLTKSYD